MSGSTDAFQRDLDEKFTPAEQAWPEPSPLRRELPDPDPYPIQALGDLLGGAAQAIGDTIQSPDALRGQSLLAAAALAVQAHADVVIDGRRFPISENFLTVGVSGERKSATDVAVLGPHYLWQRKLLDKAAAERPDFEADSLAWKKARDQALSSKHKTRAAKKAALLSVGEEPRMISDPTLLTTEPTYEGLIKTLADGWPSMGLFSDEGGRFLGGYAMTQEHRLKTASGLSEIWDGKPISRTRGGDGNRVLYGRRVSMHLMAQPGVSATLLSDPTLSDQGLLSRLLTANPLSTIGTRLYRQENLHERPEMKRYSEHMLSLLDQTLPLRQGTLNELTPRAIRPAPDAAEAWALFHDHIERMMAPDHELAPIRGLAAKAAEHALRLAGTLALVDDIYADTLSLQHVQCGITLAQYYLNEALRLYHGAAEDPDLILAETCLRWGRTQPRGRFAAVTLYQRGPNAVRNKRTAERILGLLEEHGLARQLPPGSVIDGKRRQNAWEVRCD